ncbi:hypothetical protein [Sulfuriferula nivalis]|uniref:Uncharacterized protein n=1 Tax=Sulfuriferula nivalis TaxID=2675298 RepID=A0A809RT76_9PROT|nr:hypothetical protein [Sulfuriferula nivalis]BBP02091.1 hypothetical protein SFSGTM_27990 [Sulfuriferula nivalis]
MPTSELSRHQRINSLAAQDTEKIVGTAILLWERMATQIISIVGEAGFNSLFTRSVVSVQPIHLSLPAKLMQSSCFFMKGTLDGYSTHA